MCPRQCCGIEPGVGRCFTSGVGVVGNCQDRGIDEDNMGGREG